MVALGFLLLCACTVDTKSGIQKAEWLIGTWVNQSPRGNIYESWNKANDKELAGISYVINETDTIILENIQLLQEHEQVFYIPVVKNQNGGLPVRFTAKTVSEDQLIFENPEHDFPQIISYTKISSDSLVAEISGIRKGQERKQVFAMKRMR